MNILDQIQVVLIATTHSGNIGSVARAMKVMGLSRLVLVAPQCQIDGQAVALAAGASDIMNNARQVSTLDEAIEKCGLVIGTSARSRSLSWPMLSTRICAQKVVAEAVHYPVALVFGQERMGLTNSELQKCHFHVYIDANPEYSSLNLAMAVQILSYEVRMAALANERQEGALLELDNQEELSAIEPIYPLAQELKYFYEHLERTITAINFLKKKHPGFIMERLIRLFNRIRLEEQELNILRGILSSIDKLVKIEKKEERRVKKRPNNT